MRYILAGLKFGLTAHVAITTLAVLAAVQNRILNSFIDSVKGVDVTDDIEEGDVDISDDLK